MQEASQHLPNIYHKIIDGSGKLDAKTTFPRAFFWRVQLFVCCESKNVPCAVRSSWGVERMLIVRGQGDICNSNVYRCRGWLPPNEISSLQQMETVVTYFIFDWVLVSRQTVLFSSSLRFDFMCFWIFRVLVSAKQTWVSKCASWRIPITPPQCWK